MCNLLCLSRVALLCFSKEAHARFLVFASAVVAAAAAAANSFAKDVYLGFALLRLEIRLRRDAASYVASR